MAKAKKVEPSEEKPARFMVLVRYLHHWIVYDEQSNKKFTQEFTEAHALELANKVRSAATPKGKPAEVHVVRIPN